MLENHTWIFPIFSYILVGTLAYASQLLFYSIEPGPLTSNEAIYFNVIVALTFIGYTRSWLTNPGRVPLGWRPSFTAHRGRWCRKCEAFKPARTHHCKTCRRCIPKMDHHCPWTVNCVSHRTLPHFLRFLIFGIWSSTMLETFFWVRISTIWENRHLPSYLGPSAWMMGSLFTLTLINTITMLCIGILVIRCFWSLITNVTSIESWEIERHEALVRRSKTFGGYLDGPSGQRVAIRKQEFPYDIGLWRNVTQVFGSNPILWLWPFTRTPSSESGLEFATNGFEDNDIVWPPPDPDRMPRIRIDLGGNSAFLDEGKSDQERKDSFQARQIADTDRIVTQRRKRFHQRYSEEYSQDKDHFSPDAREDGEEAWRTSEGERLADFGLDEEAEFYDEDVTQSNVCLEG